MHNKNPYAKSCIRVYNDTIQSFTVDPSTIQLEGETQVDSGCSMTLKTNSIQINRPGLYHFAGDFEATFGSDVPEIQMFLNNEAVPSAVARIPVSAADLPVHLETELCLNTCCMNHPQVSFKVVGGEAKISYLSVGAVKLA